MRVTSELVARVQALADADDQSLAETAANLLWIGAHAVNRPRLRSLACCATPRRPETLRVRIPLGFERSISREADAAGCPRSLWLYHALFAGTELMDLVQHVASQAREAAD